MISKILNQEIISKARHIQLVIFDVDGVLTNGCFYVDSHGHELKAFHTQDGLGISLLLKSDIQVAVISGRNSHAVTLRMQELSVQHVYQGQENKLTAYENVLKKLNLQDHQVAYVGDDLPDMAFIKRAGLGIAVANAVEVVKQQADWQTTLTGGLGAVREVCDLILQG